MERVTTQLPGNLVLEQDFILQIRRLHKAGEPKLVLNVRFAQMPNLVGKRDLIDATQDRLHGLARQAGGELYLMTNGDAFLLLPPQQAETELAYGAQLVAGALPSGIEPGKTAVGWLEAYPLPEAYTPLRERANYYVELAKALDAVQAETAEALLQSQDVRGPLTAYSLSQIERLLDELDIHSYIRAQTVWQRAAGQGNDKWAPLYDEHYISTADLQRDKFPHLELRASGRLFAELASLLDRWMLAAMLRGQDQWRGRPIGLNLSAGTVLSSTFAQFCHVVHGEMRKRVHFELHVSELLHDNEAFVSALTLLTQEGFRVSLDGVLPRFVDFLKLEALPVTQFKINMDRAGVKAWQDGQNGSIGAGLRALDPAKLIFMHVDSAAGLDIGQQLGVPCYQGFFLDEEMQRQASSQRP